MARESTKLAILFADVSDSTRLYELMGDTGAFGQINEVMQILARAVEKSGGWVVKTIGDGIMCAFPDADSAAVAACDMQSRVAQRPLTGGRARIAIRVGFHFGNVLREGREVIGDTVHTASRIAALATASHIAMTGATAALLSPQLGLRVRRLGALPVKGQPQTIDLHELAWQDAGQETLVPGRSSSPVKLVEPRLHLEFRQRKYTFRNSLTLGRGEASDLVIDDPMASRNHARIEKRGERFVIVDLSSNGTYITLTGRPEITLRRTEFLLYGSGQIAFGDSANVRPDVAVVRFHCESPEPSPSPQR